MPQAEHVIQNPVLPGFNPDPSIVRVGEEYYIATSTFEWYPGVQIHRSRDLVHWELAVRPLDRAAQLDMSGEPDSCGVWAPCLSYADGLFWLVYSDVKRRSGSFKDSHNYLVTAPAIEGPWSDPVHLNSSGFDPSLFHDDDGRKWVVNLVWDHRGKSSSFGGILLQEYDCKQKKLVGPIKNIFRGSPLGRTEGPHLYKRNSMYYMFTAEGGTGYNHAVTMARSKNIDGPYELHPDMHVVTGRFFPDSPLQRCGHGDFVETADGETYIVYLTSRPIPGLHRSPLGRETAIQKCVWGEDGWLRVEGEKMKPQEQVPAPSLPPHPYTPEPERTGFTGETLPSVFQWLRTPRKERLFSLSERRGYLRLFGRESIGSWYEQSLVARRQTWFDYDAETQVEAEPDCYQQMAGIIAYYNRFAYHYLALTWDEEVGKCLQIYMCEGAWPFGAVTTTLEKPVAVNPSLPVSMRIETRGAALRFYWRQEGEWQRIGNVHDNTLLSDECGEGEQRKISLNAVGIGNFTGAFVGMAAHDISGRGMPADFPFFYYKNIK